MKIYTSESGGAKLILVIVIVVLLNAAGGYALYTRNTDEANVNSNSAEDDTTPEEAPIPVVRNAGITVQDLTATTTTATSTEISTSTSSGI